MRTIFLDRDGVINYDFGYVNEWNNFKLIEGTLEALQILTKHNFNIIIVTNQAGIARGFYTEKDFKKLTHKFSKFCLLNHINILDTLYCPHHIDGTISKYIKNCYCRKPQPGMFFKASKLHNIKLETSIMVGDNITDLEASSNSGIKENFLVSSNYSKPHSSNELNFKIKKNLLAVTKYIIN